MSKLNAIQERTSAKRDLPPTENFALQVTSYGKDAKNRDSIQGIRLDTGESVEVILRPYQGTAPLKAPRAEVKDFVATENEISSLMKALPTEEMRKSVLKGMTAKTEPGGTILVQRAYVESDTNIVNAGWLQSASKWADHCKVLASVMMRVDPVQFNERNGVTTSSSTATIINPERAQHVKSADALTDAIKAALATASVEGARPLVMIRVSDQSGDAKAVEFVLPVRQDKESKAYITATPEEGLEAFKKLRVGTQLTQLAGDPDLVMEVIPGAKIALGPQAKASFEKSLNGLTAVNAPYRFEKGAQDATGFAESYVVLHQVGPGVVFTTASPISARPQLFHGRDVPTAFRSGAPAATIEMKDTPTPAPVAAETASPAADGDDEFDISDVVAQTQQTAHSAPRPRA